MKVLRTSYNDLATMIAESISRVVLKEKRNVKSKTLADMIKQYGTPRYSSVDLHNVIDDDILEVKEYQFYNDALHEMQRKYRKQGINIGVIDFNTVMIVVKPTKANTSSKENKSWERFANNRKYDGKQTYKWHNRDAEEMIFKNPYFKDWDKQHQQKAIDNVKNGKRYNDGLPK